MCCLLCGRVWESVCLLVFEVEIPWSDGDGALRILFFMHVVSFVSHWDGCDWSDVVRRVGHGNDEVHHHHHHHHQQAIQHLYHPNPTAATQTAA